MPGKGWRGRPIPPLRPWPAAQSHQDGQAGAAVLVDHVEELEAPSIGGGVELKVHGPDLVRMLGRLTTYEAVSRPGPLLFAGSRALEPLLSPEPV